jgi:signal transduction histidine kinase
VDDRVLGGVCGGLASRLRVETRTLRILAVLAVALGGFGIVAYVVLWVAIPAADESSSIGGRVVGDRRQLQAVLAFSTAVLAVLLVLQALGLNSFGIPAWTVVSGVVGALVIWRGASPAELGRLREAVNAAPVIGSTADKGWRLFVVRGLVGTVLIIFGISVLSRADGFSGAALAVLIGAVAFAVGLSVLFAPWWARTLRDLSTERRERVRAEERADVASHVHDSVLQTLLLIQKSVGDPAEVTRLARIQERELRHWLFNPAMLGRRADQPTTFAVAMADIEREVEDTYGVGIELILVGDCAMDGPTVALVGACREASINAAKWSGCTEVTVFAEVEHDVVSVFVRDLGRGFDPAQVHDDRQGIASSMVDRMARHGGRVTVSSAPGTGCEVALVLPRSHGDR